MLEKLFTSKSRVKVLGYLFFEKEKSTIREISRKASIPVSSVQREIKNLLDIGLIEKKEEKVQLNKSCSLLEDLKKIFIKTDYIYEPIKKSLPLKKVKFALIFGSFAKGNFNQDSDLDLLVVGDILQEDLFKDIRKIEKKVNREVNLVVWKLNEMKNKKNTGFFKELRKNCIFVKGDKNEFQKIVR